MPFDYTIDKQHRLVLSTVWGVVTTQEIREHDHRLRNDPDFDPTFYQLADYTAITELAVTADEVRQFAQVKLFSPDARRGFVAPEPAVYGVGRMFQTYREMSRVGEHVQIFRDRSAALQWLGM